MRPYLNKLPAEVPRAVPSARAQGHGGLHDHDEPPRSPQLRRPARYRLPRRYERVYRRAGAVHSRPALVERGLKGSADTQDEFAPLRAAGIEPRSRSPQEPNFDLAWEAGRDRLRRRDQEHHRPERRGAAPARPGPATPQPLPPSTARICPCVAVLIPSAARDPPWRDLWSGARRGAAQQRRARTSAWPHPWPDRRGLRRTPACMTLKAQSVADIGPEGGTFPRARSVPALAHRRAHFLRPVRAGHRPCGQQAEQQPTTSLPTFSFRTCPCPHRRHLWPRPRLGAEPKPAQAQPIVLCTPAH